MHDETIDYSAVIAQLQRENEALRHHIHHFHRLYGMVSRPIEMVQRAWSRLTANRHALLFVVMVLYWLCSLVFLVWDRWYGRGGAYE